MAPDATVLKKSVTKDDYLDNGGRQGAILNFFVPAGLNGMVSLPPLPPPWWTSGRDDLLRTTVFYETMWADAIYIAVTKIAALSWDVKSDVALQLRRAQQLLLQADAERGWVKFVHKHLRDYLLTDNGAFIEIVRQSSAAGSKIVGLIHLDSRRCTRTGDPDVPIMYRDKQGREHWMRDYQVIEMSDMTDPSETYYGVGMCAASRAYRAIYKLAALETYVSEKVAGRRPLAIHLTNNISREQLDEAIQLAESSATAQGRTTFMGAIVLTNIDPSVTPAVATIELAGLPDGFDAAQERRTAILSYADAIGIDPQELDPELLASKALGTGAQSRVIDDKASSRGLIAYRQDLTHQINWKVLPDRTWFYFRERDFRDQKQRADIDATMIDNATKMVSAQFMESIEGRQYLVDRDVLEREYMPVDITPTTAIADTDKLPPDEVSDEQRQAFIEQVQAARLEQQQQNMQMQAEATQAAQPPQPPPGQAQAKSKPRAPAKNGKKKVPA